MNDRTIDIGAKYAYKFALITGYPMGRLVEPHPQAGSIVVIGKEAFYTFHKGPVFNEYNLDDSDFAMYVERPATPTIIKDARLYAFSFSDEQQWRIEKEMRGNPEVNELILGCNNLELLTVLNSGKEDRFDRARALIEAGVWPHAFECAAFREGVSSGNLDFLKWLLENHPLSNEHAEKVIAYNALYGVANKLHHRAIDSLAIFDLVSAKFDDFTLKDYFLMMEVAIKNNHIDVFHRCVDKIEGQNKSASSNDKRFKHILFIDDVVLAASRHPDDQVLYRLMKAGVPDFNDPRAKSMRDRVFIEASLSVKEVEIKEVDTSAPARSNISRGTL